MIRIKETFWPFLTHSPNMERQMTSDNNILDTIPDAKPVRVFLPIKNVKERYRVQGVYSKSAAPLFSLHFKPGVIPVESINTKETCIINVDMGGPNISLEAKIKEVVNAQHLILSSIKGMSHDQMREFFRVDAVANVIGKSFHPKISKGDETQWFLKGETIDISGSGILASFSEAPPDNTSIKLEITLPSQEEDVIKVVAHVVRIMKISDKQYDVAFHFDDIAAEDRDKIIGCCLEIQRRLLRLKVKVRDL